MHDNWPKALKSILESEGFFDGKRGWMNDPADNGGPTLAGITYGNLCEWRGYPTPQGRQWATDIVAELKALSDDEISQFYYEHKWQPIRGDDLPPGIDLAVIDVCVLHGPGKAQQFLRKALGFPPKGKVDDAVVAAAHDAPDYDAVVKSIAASRRAHYDAIIANNPSQQKWRKGWYNRTARVEAECLKLCQDASLLTLYRSPPETDLGRAHDIAPPAPQKAVPIRPDDAPSMLTSKEGNIQVVNGTLGGGTALLDAQQVAVGVIQKSVASGKPISALEIILAVVQSPLFMVGATVVIGCAFSWIFRARKRWEKGI
jgi:lysozyme family protein